MTRRRSSWAAVAALAMTLTLAACGRDDEGGSGAPASQAAELDFSTASGELSVWAMGTEGDNLEVLAEDFMAEYPDVTVEVTAVPWDAAHDRISNAIAAGETPDVSLIGTTWMGEFASGGGFDPTPANIDPSIFFEGAWDTTVVDGVSYGIPWYVETRLLYYRTDLAEESGATAPPANWDELKGLAEGYGGEGADPAIALQAGGRVRGRPSCRSSGRAGGEILDESGNFTLDSDACVEALTYYDSFFEEGLAPTAALEPGALETGFASGEIGSFISGPWMIGIVNDAGADPATWTVAHQPTEEAGTSFVGGGNISVFSDSDNKTAAWAFVDYLSQPGGAGQVVPDDQRPAVGAGRLGRPGARR